MKKLILLTLLLASFANFAKDIPPALFVLKDPDDRTSVKIPLTITALTAEVIIHGNLAQTEITLTFLNHTNRNLEGEFFYPLPPNSAVTGYALDIGKKMVEGVAIEKNRATYVFEKIKSRNIDPGLVEWESKNCFKTRVFPIFPNKTRTIRVQYLTEINGDKYNLPLNFKEKIKDFKFRTIVKNAVTKAEAVCENRNILFIKNGFNYMAQFSETDTVPDFNIEIKLAKKIENKKVLVEQDYDTTYFKITDSPEVPVIPPILPEKINILWDASGSRAYADHTKELKILKDFFAKFADKTISVNVQIFSFILGKNTSFSIKNGNCEELLKFLKTIKYDGGTQLGEITLKPADFNLFFTDGISTFGNKNFPKFNSPLFIFSSSKATNIPYLQALGSKTGGAFFNLLKESNTAGKIGIPTFNFISAEYDSANFTDITPIPSAESDKTFTLTGCLLTTNGNIKINYGIGGKVLLSKEYKIHSGNAVSGTLLRKYQAMKKLDELMVMPKRNREKILALGKKHGLVTPYTSLIVLEDFDDYIEFKIPPPKSQKKMRERYFVRISGKSSDLKQQMEARINRVIEAWDNRVMWWNTVFKYKPEFKYKSFHFYYDGYFFNDAEGGDFGEDDSLGEGFDTEATFGDAGFSSGITSENIPPPVNKEYKDNDDEDIVSNVTVQQWDSTASYLTALRKSSLEKHRGIYWKLRKKYSQTPSFFMDCADFFYTKGDKNFAVQILSNIAEFNIDSAVMQRIMACKYSEMKQNDLAICILENALIEFPENPDIHRELALLIAKRAVNQSSKQKKKADYKLALDLLYKIVTSEWRDMGMALLAVMDINHMIPKAKAAGVEDIPIPLSLIRQIDVDLRIVISHFSNLQEMHCWILEPSSEKVSYVHPLSLIGGLISGEEGPEEYFVRKTMKGPYGIKTTFTGDSIEKLFGAVFFKLDIYTNYGRSEEKHNSAMIYLKKSSRVVEIGKIDIK